MNLSQYIEELRNSCAAELESTVAVRYKDEFDISRISSLEEFQAYSDELASKLDRDYHLSASYKSMDEFWNDAEKQRLGVTTRTFWDSYEHGLRRHLEARLAANFGCQETVLVNTGMSAIDVAVRTVLREPGSVILRHRNCYFETEQYLDLISEERGISVEIFDMEDPEDLAIVIETMLAAGKPVSAILLEYLENGPEQSRPSESLWEVACKWKIPVIVDNSTLSLLVNDSPALHAPNVIVVESGAKYITRSASCGVIYASGLLGSRCRDTARKTGQQLQGRALHRIRYADIDNCRSRVLLHSKNAEIFAGCIAGFANIRVSRPTTPVLSGDSRFPHPGALLYLTPVDGRTGSRASVCRKVVDKWGGQEALIRAGFGWNRTTARSYATDHLNNSEGAPYIRVSVGLERPHQIDRLAKRMMSCVDAVLGSHMERA
ncbi:PLP-dependent transferase [Nocardia carnea]|uniref:PLP-dependent transferase n=1 Tax=Nocardia carnea TaxID=37328 RepID=UPI002453E9BF|nr:PLP-dependent transferase [Nocardia carnea]